jgi:hypothetical protein
VMVLDIGTAAALWEKRLLAGVEAEPATGHGLLYIAGLDQYVWALDVATGRTAWRYLSESPLVESPTVIGDRLYEHIPTEGLVCFVADPVETPGGEIIWTSPDARGHVIGAHGDQLLVWDAEGQRMFVVEAERGAVKTTVDLPGVRFIKLSASDPWDLIAAGDDGRVIRLLPRN